MQIHFSFLIVFQVHLIPLENFTFIDVCQCKQCYVRILRVNFSVISQLIKIYVVLQNKWNLPDMYI